MRRDFPYNFIKKLKNELETKAGVSSFIEISGNGEILVTGCISIEKYSSEEIRVKTRLGRIYIMGQKLKLSIFRGDIMSVEGTVSAIKLGDE